MAISDADLTTDVEDLQAHDNVLSAMLVDVGTVTVTQGGQIAALQAASAASATTITSIQAVNVTQALDISAIQSINTSQQTEITAIQASVAKHNPVYEVIVLTEDELVDQNLQDAVWTNVTHVHPFDVVTAGTYLLTAQITLYRLPNLAINEVQTVRCKFEIRNNATKAVLSTSDYVGFNTTQPTSQRRTVAFTVHDMYNSTSPADLEVCIVSDIHVKGATDTYMKAVIKVLRVYNY